MFRTRLSILFSVVISFFSAVYPFQHFPQSVFFISPHHMPVPVPWSLRDLFGSSDLVFPCHSAHPSYSSLISFTSIRFSCFIVIAHVSAPLTIPSNFIWMPIYLIIRRCARTGAFPAAFCVPNSVALASPTLWGVQWAIH